jgi:hypothetical protein
MRCDATTISFWMKVLRSRINCDVQVAKTESIRLRKSNASMTWPARPLSRSFAQVSTHASRHSCEPTFKAVLSWRGVISGGPVDLGAAFLRYVRDCACQSGFTTRFAGRFTAIAIWVFRPDFLLVASAAGWANGVSCQANAPVFLAAISIYGGINVAY